MRNTCLWAFLIGVISHVSIADESLSIRQKILMPGPLASVHAELESKCENCHASFEKAALTQRCLDCHEDIQYDRRNRSGFHGQSPFASVASCETCHGDHEGREADIIGIFEDNFNHDFTRFPLKKAHQHLTCVSCHQPDKKFREAETACISCHKDRDIHQGNLGTQCENCHRADNWHRQLPFDHSTTRFPLEGRHSDLECSNCHIGQKYKFDDLSCVGCHRTVDIHYGANGTQCENCHSPQSWKTLSFNHDDTGFHLAGKHSEIPCQACHEKGQDKKETPNTCYACHSSADVHLGRNGESCENCHNSQNWHTIRFNHDTDTDFPLSGKHQNLICTQCHTGKIHESIGRDCASCHAGDDPHNDDDMQLCGTCHSTEGWRVIKRFDHDLSAFPLIGMHQIVPCESCHVGNQFAATPHQCIDCHKTDDVHRGALGRVCGSCHTPNAWGIWQFDHERDTSYALTGKHENLACNACHLAGSDPTKTSTACGSCHRGDDIHNGEFGARCDRCHGTDNFVDLLFR